MRLFALGGGEAVLRRALHDGLLPFLLLGILGAKTMLDWRAEHKTSRLGWITTLAAGSLILVLSIFINARGALSWATIKWYRLPVDIEKAPSRLWDWRQPQFLAGLLTAFSADFPPASS